MTPELAAPLRRLVVAVDRARKAMNAIDQGEAVAEAIRLVPAAQAALEAPPERTARARLDGDGGPLPGGSADGLRAMTPEIATQVSQIGERVREDAGRSPEHPQCAHCQEALRDRAALLQLVRQLSSACLGCRLGWPLNGTQHVDGVTRSLCLFARSR